MADYFRWFPVNGGTPIILGNETFPLRSYFGTGSTLVNSQSQKAPFQRGVSYLNANVNPRSLVVNLRLHTKTLEEMNQLKRQLISKMVAEPVRGRVAPKGLLRFFRTGAETVEIEAIPVGTPDFQPATIKGTVIDCELEFFCPFPYWRLPNEQSYEFESAGESLFPQANGLEFPFEILSGNLQVEIDNSSDVEVPIRARIYGEIDTFRMINTSINETLEITGVINEGDYIEVNTSFGNKSVIYHDSSADTDNNVFERVSLDSADFWQLVPGVNKINFEFDSNTSGTGRVFWHELRAGV